MFSLETRERKKLVLLMLMRIESVEKLDKRPDRFAAVFSDGTRIVVNASQIADFGLYSGRELSDDEYKELRSALTLSSSKSRAMRILGARSMSAQEMERRLVSKGEPREVASETVRWLEEIGAVNDEQYADSIVKHYRAKGYGIAKIRDELFRRGIPREMWDEILSGLDSFEEAAYDFVVAKLGDSRDRKDIKRVTDALCRRGFSYDEARSAVNRYLANLEENEGPEF